MTRSIIKLVVYSVPVVYHEHYAALKDQVRYCDSDYSYSKSHQYLNIYNQIDSPRWNSCIEMDHVSFLQNQELAYDNPFTDVFLVYRIEDSAVFESLRNKFLNMSATR